MKLPTLPWGGRRTTRGRDVHVHRPTMAGEDPQRPFPRRQFAALVALAVLGLLVFSFGRVAVIRFQLDQEAERLNAEIASLQMENRRLQDEIAELKTDAAVERLARERLGWTKPGETAIILVPTDQDDAAADTAPPPSPTPQPNWQRWRHLFFGR